MKKITLILIFSLVAFSFLVAPQVIADSGGSENGNGESVSLCNPLSEAWPDCEGGGEVTTLGDVLSNIIDGLQLIATPIVGIMVLFGGFQILFAGGNPEKFSTGKKTILYAVVGYAIILVANGIDALIRDILTQSGS